MKCKNLVSSILLIAIVAALAFTMMNFQLASAYPTFDVCTDCHDIDPGTTMSLTEHSQNGTHVVWNVSGSHNNDVQGWAVFDLQDTKIANGYDNGSFTLPMDGQDYVVYWVDEPSGGGADQATAAYPFTNIPEFPGVAIFLVLAGITVMVLFLARKRLPRLGQ